MTLTGTHSVLMISKPIAPPWNDGSKNLVRDLALTGTRFSYHVLTPKGLTLDGARVVSEPLYGGGGAFTPSVLQNGRVLVRLLRPDDSTLTHFFFAPNRRTSAIAALALHLRPRRVVQTVCSAPASFAGAERLLFGERVVVLSQHTARAFVEAGVARARLEVIPPGIQLPPEPDPAQRARTRARHGIPAHADVVVYPGDYQFSTAAWTVARTIPLLRGRDTHVLFACRIKQAASLEIEGRLGASLAQAGVLDRARFVGEVPDMRALLAACDVCVLPAESLYAKMDLPLVLLEAMALGLPLVVSDRGPLVEVLRGAPGASVPPGDAPALAAAIGGFLDTPPERRRELGAHARAVAAAHYDVREVSRRYEDLYDALLER